MSSIVILIVCFALGVVVARFGKPTRSFAQSLNWWVINVALTALILRLVPTVEASFDLWFLPASMWFVFLGAWVFFAMLGRRLRWTRERIGALTLVCGLGNTSFIGYPLIDALRGQDALTIALIADQTGTFLALAIGGTIVAAIYSGKVITPSSIARKVALFPPFIGLVIGACVGLVGTWPALIADVLDQISATLVPLALFSVGLQFRVRVDRNQMGAMAAGLAWKLVLAPLCVFGLGSALAVQRELLVVGVLEAAMAPMISAAILASDHDLEPELANAVLGIGILIAFITVPVANAAL